LLGSTTHANLGKRYIPLLEKIDAETLKMVRDSTTSTGNLRDDASAKVRRLLAPATKATDNAKDEKDEKDTKKTEKERRDAQPPTSETAQTEDNGEPIPSEEECLHHLADYFCIPTACHPSFKATVRSLNTMCAGKGTGAIGLLLQDVHTLALSKAQKK